MPTIAPRGATGDAVLVDGEVVVAATPDHPVVVVCDVGIFPFVYTAEVWAYGIDHHAALPKPKGAGIRRPVLMENVDRGELVHARLDAFDQVFEARAPDPQRETREAVPVVQLSAFCEVKAPRKQFFG